MLSKRYKRCTKWIKKQLDLYDLPKLKLRPRNVVLVGDTTRIEKYSWMLVFRDSNEKENIYLREIVSEGTSDYQQARESVESESFVIKAFVGDGRAIQAFIHSKIPVQMCHFHQEQIVVRCVTNNPKLEAGIEILSIIKTLPRAEEKEFTKKFNDWCDKWDDFLKEKTFNIETKKPHFTHKKLRQVRGSIKRHLPYLFTYKKHPKLDTPNTTNSLDGFFKRVKLVISIHAGLTFARKLKLVKSIIIGRE